ncbi:hypothetical protein [Novosphingobium sp. CECT 9465]|uniref:hypothetical protein n=1 Tax=Novosphingobium sp. CECT 9465 TaxID=2829794 RepID=UPI001E31A028|nr:hypothetical protein [Novosphingobium sp. CECT 9465]CAH0497010.1 hypothetical protein NVSP9465_02060 [Novosphingobium sp. CECT 9465]
MRISKGKWAAFGVVLAGAGAAGILAQQTTGPVARYEMRAETMSGFGGGMTGGQGAGGGQGGMAAAMSMAFGGAPKAQHALWLDLGSTRAQSAPALRPITSCRRGPNWANRSP